MFSHLYINTLNFSPTVLFSIADSFKLNVLFFLRLKLFFSPQEGKLVKYISCKLKDSSS